MKNEIRRRERSLKIIKRDIAYPVCKLRKEYRVFKIIIKIRIVARLNFVTESLCLWLQRFVTTISVDFSIMPVV